MDRGGLGVAERVTDCMTDAKSVERKAGVANASEAPEERMLLAAAQAGDTAAFKSIVDRYHSTVVGLAYGLIGDPAAAEDVAQETFVRAWRHLPRFEPRRRGSLKAWLCRIAHNRAMDLARRARPVELPEQLSDPGPSPFESASSNETGRLVREAVLRLPGHCRGALVLREYQGLTYREIADVLDIPIGTVMSRLHDARRRLAADLAPLMEVGASR